MDTYDVIVVGAGPAGENVADRVVRAGLSAVVVEPELVGGECSYWACVPSKAMLRPGTALAEARSVDGAREAVRGGVDPAAVLARRERFVGGRDDAGQVGWLESAGIDLVRGSGRIVGERTVEVGERTLTARHAVVLCTGSDAVLPPIEGLAAIKPWTSREATSAPSAPGRLAVLGGGVVGVEMALAWRDLGSEVTLLVRGGGVLASWEPFVGEMVVEGLKAAGIDVRTGVGVTKAARVDGTVVLDLSDGGTLESDEFLVAAGRRPRTGSLGLETIGLDGTRPLEVDDTCQVGGHSWLYACGDVNGRAPLTHMGKYQARACAAAIVARAGGEGSEPRAWSAWSATADHTAVPQVVFARPEAASVGLSEAAARAAGIRVRAVEIGFDSVSGAGLFADGYEGRAKLVVDEDRGIVVGCTFAGPGCGELLHAATIAVVGEIPLHRLWHAVPAFPTMSEIWLRLLEAYGL